MMLRELRNAERNQFGKSSLDERKILHSLIKFTKV